MPNNNKMKVLMWVAGVLSSIIITFLVGLTNHVIANDKLSRERDTNIKTEQVEGDQKIQECINEKFADIIDAIARLETRQQIILEKVKDE